MCLHLYGGNPREGVEACLWQGCDEDRTKVTFMRQGKFSMSAVSSESAGIKTNQPHLVLVNRYTRGKSARNGTG